MLRDAAALNEQALRDALAAAEERFAADDRAGALDALEQLRRAASAGSRVWAEVMADIAVVLHASGDLYDAHAHARRALEAAPGLEEARETAAICASALGLDAPAPARGERVLIVVDNFFPSRGGTEVLAEDLAVSLSRLGHPVEVLCRAHPQRQPAGRGIPVHEFEPGFADRALAALLQERRFGGVIGISVPMGFPVLGILRQPASIAGMRSLVVPCVNEEVDATVRASPDFMRDYGRLLQRVDAVGFSSHAGWDRRLLDDLGVAGVYLPNAVPAVEQSGSLREALEVSRGHEDHPACGQLLAAEEPPRLPRPDARDARATGASCASAAPSADHPQLAQRVAAAAARDPRVTLLGAATREEVAGAMLQSDLLVLPSIAEATPLVLLEAMSHGLPWIASDTCGSASELSGGSVVPVQEFAPEIERLLADSGARKALAAAGRAAYADGYSWEAVAPRYLAALDLPAAVRLAVTG